MKHIEENTPPASMNGDEISEVIHLDDEMQFEDEELEFDEEYLEEIQLEFPEDLSTIVFDKHEGSIFCCDLHPSGKLAVTGGEDDKAYVWSVDTAEVVLECSGHKDSVIYVGFSFDGSYLATADMGGLIKVWKYTDKTELHSDSWPVAFEYEADDLTWGLWHFGARVLIFGTVAGDIYVFKIPSGDTKVLQGHNIKVECGKLFEDGMRLVAGYEDGAVKVWDLKSSSIVQQISTDVHQMRVTAIDTHPENNLMASISSDGKLVLATSSNGKIVGQLEVEQDLEQVAFSKEPLQGYLALGTLTGSVSIWDVARQMVRHHCSKSGGNDAAGVTKMLWVKYHLVTGCLDGSVRVYEGRSGEQVMSLTGHLSEILDLSFNEKENLILTTSDDGSARIFKYDVNKDND